MSRDRIGIVWAGVGLIGVGIALLLAQWIGWDRIWPVFLLLGGVAFFVGYVQSGFQEEGFVFVGALATLIGAFLFGFTLGAWEWSDMGRLWPVFLLIGGASFIALFLAQPKRDVGVFVIACVAIAVGLVGLAVTNGLLSENIVKLWPLLIVLVGVIGLVGAVSQMLRAR